MSDVVCPTCRGDRQVMAFVDGRDKNGKRWGRNGMVDCMTCEGTGSIPVERARWMEEGRTHRQARVDRRESLHEAAQRLGITPAQVSAMETGRQDPAGLRKGNGNG